MATTLERRLEALEDAGSGGECPRCSGIVATFINGELHDASRHGKPMSEEEYRAHQAEEDPDGKCPVCGGRPTTIKGP